MKSSKGQRQEKGAAPSGKTKKVQFECAAEPGSQVFVAGTFNDWSPTANPLKDSQGSGHFKTALELPAGTHEYKFVMNGVWISDPKCPDQVSDGCGALNSMLKI